LEVKPPPNSKAMTPKSPSKAGSPSKPKSKSKSKDKKRKHKRKHKHKPGAVEGDNDNKQQDEQSIPDQDETPADPLHPTGSAPISPGPEGVEGKDEEDEEDEDENEDDIDLEEETRKLKELEEVMEENQAEALRLRTIVENSKRVKLDKKASSLENKLKSLDTEIKENRAAQQETHQLLGNMHESSLKVMLMEAEFDKEVWDIEQDYALDDVVLKKMERDKVQEQLKLLEELQMDKLAALEAVEEERKRRKYEQENKLDILLGKIPHLAEVVGEEGAGGLGHGISQKIMGEYGDEEDDEQVYRLGDEINKMREERHHEAIEEMRNSRVDWVKKRDDLMKEREEMQKQLLRVAKLEKKGRDYLVKLELGDVKENLEDVPDEAVQLPKVFDDLPLEEGAKEPEQDGAKKEAEGASPKDKLGADKEETTKNEGDDENPSPDKTGEGAPDQPFDPIPIPEPPHPPPAAELAKPDYKDLMTKFYEQYNPAKVDDVEKVLKKKKTDADMQKTFESLAKKYNCENPLPPEKARLDESNKEKQAEYDKLKVEYDAKLAEWEEEKKKIEVQNEAASASKHAKVGPPKKETKLLELPPEMLLVTEQVENLMPKSETNLEKLEESVKKLEVEYEWVQSTKPMAWVDAEKRLDSLDEEQERRLKSAFTNEFKAFDEMTAIRERKKARKAAEFEIHETCIALQKEVVEEAVRGVWVEILRLVKFSERQANDSIFYALSSVYKDNVEENRSWRPSMWYGGLMQLQRKRKEEDASVFGTPVCRRSQKLREHFISIDTMQAKREDKKRKLEDINAPDVTDRHIKIVSATSIAKIPSSPPDQLATFKSLEKRFWDLASTKMILLPTPRSIGGVTKICTGSCEMGGRSKVMLAAGTTKGAILIFYLEPKSEKIALVRLMNDLPKQEQSPINSLQLSSDASSQLLSVDNNDAVRLWTIETKATQGDKKEHTRDAFQDDPRNYAPPIPAVALTITGRLLQRPGFLDSTVEKRVVSEYKKANEGRGFLGINSKGKKQKDEELKELMKVYSYSEAVSELNPSVVKFHPSMTIMATQCSLVIGCQSGQLVKWNNMSKVAGATTVSTHNVIYGAPVPITEPADPTDATQLRGNGAVPIFSVDKGSCPKREYFEFHKAKVLGIHFIEHAKLDMVTVDENAFLAIWKYTDEFFSGHSWFEPYKRSKLNFHLDEDGDEEPKLITSVASTSGKDLFLLVQSRKFLRIHVLNLATLQFLPHTIKHHLNRVPMTPPTISVMPPFLSVGSDYIIIVVSDEVFMYSVESGEEILPGGKKLRRKETEGHVLGVEVASTGELVCYETPNAVRHIVVDVLDYSKCFGEEGKDLREQLAATRARRASSIVREFSVKAWEWDLDEDGQDYKSSIRNIVTDAVNDVFVISENNQREREKMNAKELVKQDSMEHLQEEALLTFLGEENLGSVEPLRLRDVNVSDLG